MGQTETFRRIETRVQEGAPETVNLLPERSWREWSVAGILFAGSCLYYSIFYHWTALNGDEGIVLQGAQRILNGEVLYRDFFSFVTPGSYYWTALLFKVFGSSILVARAALILYGGLFAVFIYVLARRVCSTWTAIFTAYLFTLTCLPYQFMALHNWDSTLWACAALYLAVRFVETPHWGQALACGTFASLTCLFEQSKGAGLVAGLVLGMAALAWAQRHQRYSVAHLYAFLAGLGFPALVTVAYFATQHGLTPMLEDCLWPLYHYSAANRLPFGAPVLVNSELAKLHTLPWGVQLLMLMILSPYYILPVLSVLAVGYLLYWLYQLRSSQDEKVRYFVVVSSALVGILLSAAASGRPDVSHLIIFNGPICFLLLAWSLEKTLFRSGFLNGVKTLASFYLFFSFTALGLTLLWRPMNAHTVIHTRRGDLRAGRADTALDELQARIPAGREIFVYPYQPLYYYLTATFNPTRFEYLQLGMHTREQFEMAAQELAASRVPVVVFQPSFPEFIPQGWPATPPDVLAEKDPVTEYILGHYHLCETLTSVQNWQLTLMVRQDLPCSGPW